MRLAFVQKKKKRGNIDPASYARNSQKKPIFKVRRNEKYLLVLLTLSAIWLQFCANPVEKAIVFPQIVNKFLKLF